jgi:predicted S18 family serine protease
VVDSLNRRVHEIHATSINMYQTDVKGIILEATKSYLQYMESVTNLQQDKTQQKIEEYELGMDGILLYRKIVCVPNSAELKSAILK